MILILDFNNNYNTLIKYSYINWNNKVIKLIIDKENKFVFLGLKILVYKLLNLFK